MTRNDLIESGRAMPGDPALAATYRQRANRFAVKEIA